MLRDTDVKDINRIIDALINADRKSNGRYKLDRIITPLQGTAAQMKDEPEILRKLELYHTQFGINTYNYINKVYPDLDAFKKEMAQLLEACEKLKVLILEYRQIYTRLPQNSRRQLEQLLVRPDKVDEAQRLFANLKGRSQ